MENSDFNQKIKALQQQVGELQQHTVTSPAQLEAVLPGVLDDLQNTLEELQVAEEELRRQNEELTSICEAMQHDITMCKASEEIWQKYEFIINTSQEFITLIGKDYIYKTANESYCKAHNKMREEIIDKTVADVWGEETFNTIIKGYLDRCFAGDEVHYQHWCEFAALGRRCFDVAYYPYYDDEGTVTDTVVVSRDITERKRAEEALRKVHEELEIRIEERAAELSEVNTALRNQIAERKQTEEALRKSEKQFRAIIEATPVPIVISRVSDGTILFANAHLGQTFGLPLVELLGRKTPDFYYDPADRQVVLEALERDGYLPDHEVRAKKEDGTPFWVIVSIQTITFEGEPALLSGFYDVTERKAAEEQLRFQAQLLDSVRESVVATDLEGQIIYWGKGAEVLYGYAAAEVMGKLITFIVEPQEEEEERMRQVREMGLWSGQYLQQCKDGSKFWADTVISLVTDRDGQPVGLIGIDRDITERKQMEETLRESEERLYAIANAVPDLMFALDEEGRYVEIFTGQDHLLYAEATQLKGRLLHDVLPEEDADLFLATIRRTIETKEPQKLEYVLDVQTGRRWFEARTAPLFGLTDKTKLVVWVSRDISDRKRAEISLEESEAKFRALVEMTTATTFIYHGTRFLYVNPATEAITGYSQAELMAMNFWDVMHPDFRELVKRRGMARQRGEAVPPRYEVKLLTKSGEERWVDATLGVIEFEGEVAVLGTAFDITDRKQAEAERKQLLVTEREQRILAETLAEVFLVLTTQISYDAVLDEILHHVQRIVSFSAVNIMLLEDGFLRIARWRGYESFGSEELLTGLQQSLADFPLDAKVVQTRQPLVVADTRRNSDWVTVEESAWIRSFVAVPICLQNLVLGLLRLDGDIPNQFSSKDAECLQPLANAAAMALENARLYDELWQELTERLQIEFELRQSETRNKALLDAIPDLMFRLTRKGVLLDYNAGNVDDLYIPSEEFLGKRVSDISPPEIAELSQRYIDKTLDTGAMQTFEFQLSMPLGIQEYEARVVASGKNEVIIILRNITRRKWAEQQVIRAERLAALGRLTATLAHEINNPLQAIWGQLDLVLDFSLGSGERQKYLEIIRHEIRRLRDIAQNMLKYTQPIRAPHQLVYVGEVMQQVLALASKQLEQSNIQITTNLRDVPPVLATPDQLSQIFLNLVINAIEAISTNGQLDITVYPEGEQVAISFTNSGPAIPMDVLPHIFDPFFSTKPDGSGLGLWTCHNLVQQYGGSLTVENVRDHQGVIFIVKLPSVQ